MSRSAAVVGHKLHVMPSRAIWLMHELLHHGRRARLMVFHVTNLKTPFMIRTALTSLG